VVATRRTATRTNTKRRRRTNDKTPKSMLSVAIRRKTIKYQSQRQLQRGPLAQKIIKNQYRHQTNKKKTHSTHYNLHFATINTINATAQSNKRTN
jgi:hypothetical protein